MMKWSVECFGCLLNCDFGRYSFLLIEVEYFLSISFYIFTMIEMNIA